MICTTETNFCRVFELPESFPEQFCWGGGIPVTFKMVDWFNPVPDSMQDKDWETEVKPSLVKFILPKAYVQLGRCYLVLTDFGNAFIVSK